VPYGQKTLPAPDNPRMRILVEDEEEQAVLAQIRSWAADKIGITEIAARLNASNVKPPQGEQWTKSLLYNLKLRLSWISPRPLNQRPYSDEEVKERIIELRGRGHSHKQIATILNEQGWIPLKGRQFTDRNVGKLLRRTDETKLLSPRRYLELILERMQLAHDQGRCGETFERPGLSKLASLLTEAGYQTPRGRPTWWPAQVQQLLDGRFDTYYQPRAD
jgi:hypothetical protein